MTKPNLYSLVANSRSRAENYGLTEHFTEAELERLLQACDYRCMGCSRSTGEIMLSVDHVVPFTRQGKNTVDNLQILCGQCNSRKFDKIIDYRVSPPLVISDVSIANRRKKPADSTVDLYLRLPPDLHAWVKELAEDQHRSLNSQVIILLRQAKERRRLSQSDEVDQPGE